MEHGMTLIQIARCFSPLLPRRWLTSRRMKSLAQRFSVYAQRGVPLEPGASDAYVRSIMQLTPTVRVLDLEVVDTFEGKGFTKIRRPPLSFMPGQWVDLFIPGQPTVCGFSICSSPVGSCCFPNAACLDPSPPPPPPPHARSHPRFEYGHCKEELPHLRLAVKNARHPPTKWAYNDARVGDQLQVRLLLLPFHCVPPPPSLVPRRALPLAADISSRVRAACNTHAGSRRGRFRP